jgi:hypothetical protein
LLPPRSLRKIISFTACHPEIFQDPEVMSGVTYAIMLQVCNYRYNRMIDYIIIAIEPLYYAEMVVVLLFAVFNLRKIYTYLIIIRRCPCPEPCVKA